MSFVAIVDYGMCNLDSIRRAVEECGGNPRITDDVREIAQAERIVLPGVGAFADAMSNLRERKLDLVLREQAANRVPLLGVCLGMQLLADAGEEGVGAEGLGLIPGRVVRLQPTEDSPRIPHIGWNEVYARSDSPLFQGIGAGKDFYFVHSFHFQCADAAHAAASTPYCGGFTSVVARDSIMGVQFHPEKSQKVGFALLRNFLGYLPC
jgi:glutamine amidotransferase